MSRSVLIALRVLLALLFAGSLVAQVSSGSIAGTVPAGGPAAVLMGLVVAGAFCVEVVLLSVWMLVAMVRDEEIFDAHGHADRWVNAAIGALITAAVVAAGGFVYFVIAQALAPTPVGLTLVLLAAAASGISTALALLVVVMRRLLHTAIRLRSELDEVI